MTFHFRLILAAALLAAPLAALSHDDPKEGGRPPEKLGQVHFPTSCEASVQSLFERGVALLHSFWFPEGLKTFNEVLKRDPSCTIAYWGIAVNRLLNPFGGAASEAVLVQGQEAIEKGLAAGAKTERERDYLEAVAAYYENFASRTERERQLARAKAYEALAAKYPSDDEAQIFYALYLAGTQLASDQSYSAWLKAAGILEKQFAKHPNHPGVAHYLIHSYDAPPIAQQGMPAARLYARIAPDAPHALHMPSHIFTRVGAWADSATTNRRSADTAQRSNDPDDALHALDYMTYAYLQLARDGDARKILDEARTLTGINPARATAYYALAAMPARHVVERGAWRDAAKLAPSPSNFPFTEAMTHFARALGAARSGDPAAAQEDLEKIVALRDRLKAAKIDYWANEVEVMRLASLAWVALAQKGSDEALALMRQAADLEDRSEKNIVTPGRLLPARELLGDMLMELKRPAEAFKEYEASQQREPNRYRGLYGAGQAAAQSGNRDKARHYFSKLIELAGSGDRRPEMDEARRYLASK